MLSTAAAGAGAGGGVAGGVAGSELLGAAAVVLALLAAVRSLWSP